MYSKFMMRIMNVLPFLGNNGSGPSTGTSGGGNVASGLANLLAWIGEALVNIVTTIWGWVMALFYNVIKLVLNIMDVLQFFVNKLVGIDIYNNPDWSGIFSLQDSDLIIKLITSKTVIKLFKSVLILSAVLLIIFCIIAIVKSNFDSAMGADDGKEGMAQKVMKKAAKSIFFCFLVPFLLIVGILGSNVVLASICNAINGNNDLTLGGIIFTTSSYDANKYRVYAKNGQRVPMYYANATKVINQGDYRTTDDMRALFYYMAKGEVYISGITEKTLQKRMVDKAYDDWYYEITSMDKHDYTLAEKALEQSADILDVTMMSTYSFGFSMKNILEEVFDDDETVGMSAVATAFEEDFKEWYAEHFNSTPLNDLGMLSPITWKIESSNWYRNWGIDSTMADFSSTYYVSADNLYFNSTGAYVDIFDNTGTYADYESFATLPLEYFVMADVMDYAIEHNQQFYFVNADNAYIKWSDIQVGKKEEKVNVSTYANNYAVFSYMENDEVKYITFYGDLNDSASLNAAGISKSGDVWKNRHDVEIELLSTNAFYVSYYDGTNRLYWSRDDVYREQDGATFIICTRDETGLFIPVTQKTTSFHSDFLAEDYDGPVVARGLFDTNKWIPTKTPQPTAIREQLVDDSGNEVSSGLSTDTPSLRVVNYSAGNPITDESLSSFIGHTHEGDVTLIGDDTGIIADEEMYPGATGILKGALGLDLLFAEGGTIPNLYINKNIKNYNIVGEGADAKITFYDEMGYPMPWGGDDAEVAQTTQLPVSSTTVKLYYIMNKEGLYRPIVSYENLDTSSISKYWSEYSNDITKVGDINLLKDAIIVQYEAELVSFTPSEEVDELNMLVGARAVGIAQDEYNDGDFVTSGIFNIPYMYSALFGSDDENIIFNAGTEGNYFVDYSSFGMNGFVPMYGSTLENLYIKDGSVYRGNGQKFLAISDVVEGFYDYSINYKNIEAKTSVNILFELMRTPSGALNELYKHYSEVLNEDADILAVIGGVTWDLADSLTAAINAVDANKYKNLIYSMLYGQDFLIGLGASVQPLEEKYFGYEQVGEDVEVSTYTATNVKVGTGKETGADIRFVNEPATADKTYGTMSATVEANVQVIMKSTDPEEAKVVAVLIDSDDAGKYNEDNHTIHTYILSFNVDFTKCGKYAFGGRISNVHLDPPDAVEASGKQYILVKNGAIYCPTLQDYVLTIDGIKHLAIGALSASGEPLADTNAENMFELHTIAEYNNRYIYFEKGNFGLNLILDFTFHAKGVTIFEGLAVRFGIGFVRDYNVNVIYRLEGGGFLLNYNFNPNTGIAISNLYELRYINPLILLFATAIVFGMLWNMVWNLIARIYEIGIRFIILPAVLSVDVLSEGKFKAWKDTVVEKVMAAYSVLIMLNLYFALIPSISELTTGLVSWEDLPTTFTGMFANIGVGASGLIASISNFNGGIASGLISNLISALKETTIVTVSGWLNKLIFMMFFLVLTTLVKQGHKILGKFTGGGDENIASSDTKDAVNKMREDFDKSEVMSALKKTGKFAGDLAIKGTTGLFKGASNLLGSKIGFSTRKFEAGDLTGGSRGSLTGSSFASGSPTTVNATIKTSGKTSRYGAGGRAFVPDTGVGGGSGGSGEEEKEKKTVVGGVMSMTSQDAPGGDDEGGKTVVVQTHYGGGSSGGGDSSSEMIEEPIQIDDSLTPEQMIDKSKEYTDSAKAKREEAKQYREMAEDELNASNAKIQEIESEVEDLKKQLEQAKVERGQAYDLKRRARTTGERADAVEVDGQIVDAQRAWADASRRVKEIEAKIETKREEMQDVEILKQSRQDMIAEAEALERQADLDDKTATQYYEAAQDKEMEQTLSEVKAELKADIAKVQGDVEAVSDEVTKVASDTVDLAKKLDVGKVTAEQATEKQTAKAKEERLLDGADSWTEMAGAGISTEDIAEKLKKGNISVEQIQTERERLTSEIEKVNASIEKMKQTPVELSEEDAKESRHLSAEITNNEGELRHRQEKLAHTEEMIADLEKRGDERAQDKRLEGKYQAAIRKRDELNQKIEKQTETIETMKARLAEIEGKKSVVPDEVVTEEKIKATLESYLASMNSELESRGGQGAGMSADVRAELDSVRGDIEAVSEEVRGIASDTSDRFGKLEGEHKALADKTAGLEGEHKTLADKATELEGKIAEDSKERAEIKTGVEGVRGDLEALFDETARVESDTVDKIKEVKEDGDALFDLTAELEGKVVDGFENVEQLATDIDGVAQGAFEAIDTKADAELTREAIDSKADAGIVADIANVTGARIKKHGKNAGKIVRKPTLAGMFEIYKKDDDDDDPDDDPTSPGGGGSKKKKKRQQEKAEKAIAKAKEQIEREDAKAQAKAEAKLEKATAKAEKKAQAKEEKLIAEIEAKRRKAEAKREAELEREASKQVKQHERQERAEERKIVRDAYIGAAKEGLSEMMGSIKSKLENAVSRADLKDDRRGGATQTTTTELFAPQQPSDVPIDLDALFEAGEQASAKADKARPESKKGAQGVELEGATPTALPEGTENQAKTSGTMSGASGQAVVREENMTWAGLASSGTSTEGLEKRIKSDNVSTEEIESERKILSEEIARMNEAIQKSKDMLASTAERDAKESKHLSAEITNNEGELRHRQEKLAHAEEIIADLSKRKKERKNDSDLEDKYQAALKKRDELTQKIQTQQENIDAMKSKLSEIETRRKTTTDDVQSGETIRATMESFLSSMDTELERRKGVKPDGDSTSTT